MRTRRILRIGISVSVTIYSACSVTFAEGRRRNRGAIRHGGEVPETSTRDSSGQNENHPRSLGVGLEDLKYGTTKVQHYKESKSKGKGKGKGKGIDRYYSNDSRGGGKGYGTTGYGTGVGKGHSGPDSMASEDVSSSSPGLSTKSTKPNHQRKEYKSVKGSKQTKLTKSEKGSPTRHPLLQPTNQPTNGNKPTSPTTSEDDRTGLLTPYTISYAVTDDERPPFRSELLEVVELTRTYLDSYFLSNYKKSDITTLSKVMTLFTNTAFEFGEAIPIDFESKALFESSSQFIPDKEDLDKILVTAFQGDNLDGYVGLLQSLPPSNLFSSTQYAKLIETTKASSSTKYEVTSKNSIARNLTLGSIVVGGVAGLMVIFVSTKNFGDRQARHKRERNSIFGNESSTSVTAESLNTRGSRHDDRIFAPSCDELYNDHAESRR